MSFLLVVILLTVLQHEISTSEISVRNYNETFDINIGAGYGVGIDQNSPSISPLPKSTTTINHSTSPISKILAEEIQSNEANKARKVSARNIERTKPNPNHGPYFQNEVDYRNPKVLRSNNYKNSDDSYYQVQPNVKEIQTMINTLEGDDKYSKVIQVLKVPAVYEIHLQSNLNKNKYIAQPTKNNVNPKPVTNLNLNYDDYIKWLNDYYSQRESQFGENSLGNLLHFGKTDTSLGFDGINAVPLSSQSHQQWSSKSFTEPSAAPHPPRSSFKKNKEIIDSNQPPQAIFEVPAPYLGNPSKSRIHRTTKTVPTIIRPPEAHINQAPQRLNVYSTVSPTIPYDYRISRQIYRPGNIQNQHGINTPQPPRGINTPQPSRSKNQNLVYGRPIDKVLSPQSIGIPHRRTAQVLTKPPNVLNSTKRVDPVNANSVYFTTEKCSQTSTGQLPKVLPPGNNIRKRKLKTVPDVNRRTVLKENKVPDYYVIVTRIHENDNSAHKK